MAALTLDDRDLRIAELEDEIQRLQDERQQFLDAFQEVAHVCYEQGHGDASEHAEDASLEVVTS